MSKASKDKKIQPSTLRIGKRYRPTRLDGPYDAIVIGSGMGGLSTAGMLSKAGKKVLVLEQHYTAGGYTHAYSRNGYEWDAGLHYIGEMGNKNTPIRRMFDYITDGELKWASMGESYDRFYFGDEVVELKAGRKNFINGLAEHFPEERKAIERYVKLLDRLNTLLPLFTADKMIPEKVAGIYNALKRRTMPSYFNKTTYEVLRTLTDNESLIAVLTGQWGDCGLPPKESSFVIHGLIARHYLYGGYYPVGGSSRIAETVIPVIQASGGELMTYAQVDRIAIEGGKAVGVVMDDGTYIASNKVISNAGVFNTFGKMIPEQLAKETGYLDEMKRVHSSHAHFGMYIGLEGTAEELGLPKTNFWVYPDENPEKNVQAFMDDMEAPLPLTYISFPSAKDPSWESRYPGKSTIEIVALANYEWFEKWKDETWGKRGEDYEELKESFENRMLEVLYDKLPQLKGKLDYYETSTPLSTEYFCAYQKGELYGLHHDPSRFNQQWLRPKTRIPGLYLTGQDVLFCGVASALMSGLMTSSAVLGLQSYKWFFNNRIPARRKISDKTVTA